MDTHPARTKARLNQTDPLSVATPCVRTVNKRPSFDSNRIRLHGSTGSRIFFGRKAREVSQESAMKRYLLPILFALIAVPVSHASVVVFDRVTTKGTPVSIEVLTQSGFFASGGRLVDIYLNDDHLKTILTGGDGYGYLKFTPQVTGLNKITAQSDHSVGDGRLLVLSKSDQVILIETESAFKDSIFSDEVRKSSQKVVNRLSEKYRIIYLNRLVGRRLTAAWLEKNDFPQSVILSWKGTKLLSNLEKKGVQLYAIIGSASALASAGHYIDHRFSFEKTRDGKTVNDWTEILDLLMNSSTLQNQDGGAI